MSIILSICIPTYNRSHFLRAAIESILTQTDKTFADEIEIVISDNASTDNTAGLIKKLQTGSKVVINYFRNERNVGFDRNCLLSVERACGRYVWLLGSDDLLAADSLKNILRELKKPVWADLYFGEKEDFYLTPDQPMRFRRIMKFANEMIFDFSRKRVLAEYFRKNKKLIAYLNFLSNIIFDREKWNAVNLKEKFVGTEYVHVYVFQSLLWGANPGIMKYLPYPLVKRRWGNDGPAGPEARLRVDAQMYRRIAAAVFTDRKYIRRIDNLVIRNDVFSWTVRAKIEDGRGFYLRIFPFLWNYYWNYSFFWLKIFPLLLVPNFVLKIMRNSYRKYVKGESFGSGDGLC